MIPVLIVVGIIFIIAIVLWLIGLFNVRKKFSYKIKTHIVEVTTANLSVKLFVDSEEKDKMSFNTFGWYNATLTAFVDEETIVVKIKRKTLIGSPKIDITLNGKTPIFKSQNENNAS